MAGDVVVRKYPGGRGPGEARLCEVVRDDGAELGGVEVGQERSKLKAWPSPSGEAYLARRSAVSTHASATANRGGSYSLKTLRHSA
jgi:hypothetical protein